MATDQPQPAQLTAADLEPDYITAADLYAGQAINGILAAGGFPHEAESLADAAWKVAKAMLRHRTLYFAAHPVGVPTGHEATVADEPAAAPDYSRMSAAAIQAYHARRYQNKRPYPTLAAACADIPTEQRYIGLQVAIEPGYYVWWPTEALGDADLVPVYGPLPAAQPAEV